MNIMTNETCLISNQELRMTHDDCALRHKLRNAVQCYTWNTIQTLYSVISSQDLLVRAHSVIV
jgi:hypothetical protein